MRIACVAIPMLDLQALLRADPELRGRPLALVHGPSLIARVLGITREARAAGVRLGQTAAQARAVLPTVTIRPLLREQSEAARSALFDAGLGFAPRVEPDGDAVLLEVGDLGRLYPSEHDLGLGLLARVASLGLAGRVGIASSKSVARLAAWAPPVDHQEGGDAATRHSGPILKGVAQATGFEFRGDAATRHSGPILKGVAQATGFEFRGDAATRHSGPILKGVAQATGFEFRGDVRVVPVGREAGFVAPLPISLLRPSPEAAEALGRWGVRRCGELAGMEEREVALRLGEEGARLVRLARGCEGEPLQPRAPTDTLEEGISLDFPVENLETLAFLARGLVDRLLDRLGARHLACAGLVLRLALDSRSHDVREIPVGAPTREAATLVELLRLSVARRPPDAAIVGVTLAALAARARESQLDLFHPATPAPDRLATVVARLEALVGEGEKVGSPRPVDTWRDEAIHVSPLTLPQRANEKGKAKEKEKGTEKKNGNLEVDGNEKKNGHERTHLALRRFRPAPEVEVLVDGGHVPRALSGAGLSAQVVVAAGPYRVRGEWWQGGGFARDYWDVHASDGTLYRLYCDPRGNWFVDGYYD